jgi:hypothetical protein
MKKLIMRLIVVSGFIVFESASALELKDLPKEIAVSGTVASFQAIGAQIYACTENTKGTLEWTFREPVASLLQGGKTVGRHFVGPSWEFSDTTHVQGNVVGKTPGNTTKDVPWLKISIVDPAQTGPVSGATTVLRIDTKGGALEGACAQQGELRAEPYSATYVFVK